MNREKIANWPPIDAVLDGDVSRSPTNRVDRLRRVLEMFGRSWDDDYDGSDMAI